MWPFKTVEPKIIKETVWKYSVGVPFIEHGKKYYSVILGVEELPKSAFTPIGLLIFLPTRVEFFETEAEAQTYVDTKNSLILEQNSRGDK